MARFRAVLALLAFFAFTLSMIPVQFILLKLGVGWQRTFPQWFHRTLCRIIGVRVRARGQIEWFRPTLVVSNHVSWLDIIVLSSVAPISFVAKKEVGTWPGVGLLARLQRTIFVDRERRRSAHDTSNEMLMRLGEGDNIVLFAEGTSSDGNRVLPFRSSLFAAAKPIERAPGISHDIAVQPLAIAYTSIHGLPMGRHLRPGIAWYGDMDLASHVWDFFVRGPVDAVVEIGPPILLDEFRDRKELAAYTEAAVRKSFTGLLFPHHKTQESDAGGLDAPRQAD